MSFDAITNADLPTIQGTVLLGAFFIVLANLVVDIGYAFIDPRVRYS
jgi:peptide/nickel transport system permease protein